MFTLKKNNLKQFYLAKEVADEVIRKRGLLKNIRSYILSLNSLSLEKLPAEQLSFLKAVLSFFSSFSEEKEISDILLHELPYRDKDALYRKIWAEHVLEDIQGYADTADIQITEKEAEAAAERYVNGEYDCNLSYWENIHNLLENRKMMMFQMRRFITLHPAQQEITAPVIHGMLLE